jgi:hypothetical protein
VAAAVTLWVAEVAMQVAAVVTAAVAGTGKSH